MNFKVIFTMLTLIVAGQCMAQQQAQFTQYLYNMLPLNPAYAGSQESMSVTALAREQWTGIDGAPSTQTLSIHSPLPNKNVGVGLTLINDKIGVTNQTSIFGAYSYQLRVNEKAKLSMGIQAGATFYNSDFASIDTEDPLFTRNIKETRPNFGFGLYYYSDKYFVGVSAPQLLEKPINGQDDSNQFSQARHYTAVGGYVFDINQSIKLKPTVLAKYVDGSPMQFDLSANAYFKEVIGLGLSWRSFDSFDVLAQLQLTDQLQLGYAYDFFTTTDLAKVNSGSHEIMVNYRFSFSKTDIISPRYF
jgi:type IX secretion system PorP/SprF family membrane protein